MATKLLPVWPTAERTYEHGRLSRLRMGLDRIDLYQVHARNPLVPLASTMAGMRRLLDDGIIRHVGVSNFSASAWRSAEDALGSPVMSNQVQYNLLFRKHEAENLDHAAVQGPPRDRLQPAGQGSPRGPLRRRERPDVTGSAQRSAVPAREPPTGRPAARRPPPGGRKPRRLARPGGPGLGAAASQRGGHPRRSSVEQLERNVEAADLELTVDEDAELTAASDDFELVGPAAAAHGFAAQRRRPRSAGTTAS